MVLHPFNRVSVISEQWESDNERLYVMESHLWLESLAPSGGLKPHTLDEHART